MGSFDYQQRSVHQFKQVESGTQESLLGLLLTSQALRSLKKPITAYD
jgi:hypothetical protein